MKALTFGLMLVLVALVAVGTASAGITYGTPTAIGTCGVDCTIYTVTDTNIFTTYSSAGAAIPLLLPEFGGSPSQLTSAVFSVDGYVEGTISLINGGCCASYCISTRPPPAALLYEKRSPLNSTSRLIRSAGGNRQ